MDLLQNNVIGDTWDGLIVQIYNTDAAANKLSKRVFGLKFMHGTIFDIHKTQFISGTVRIQDGRNAPLGSSQDADQIVSTAR